MLYDIIENGPFGNDNKSLITWNKLNEIKPIIIAFSTSEVGFPDTQDKFDDEMIKINKRRAAMILTVTSWLRTVPNKKNITEKDIKEIVPSSLSLKQLIDILSNMIKLDDKTKPTIRINKNTFAKATDVILPSYVLDDTIKILTDKLDDKIQIKDLIKYFKSKGTVYTFFKYKNILRLTYDYTLGNIDKIIINLSKVIDWLETTSVNKITNADIERFDKKEVSGGVSRTTRSEKNSKNKNRIPSTSVFQPPTPFRFTAPNPQEVDDVIMDEQLPAQPLAPAQPLNPSTNLQEVDDVIMDEQLPSPPPALFTFTKKDPFPAPAPAPFLFTKKYLFPAPAPGDESILVDTLHFLIKEGVLIKSKLIRVSDFNAIETLDPTNVDRNTKIISWLIDPSRATLPKPTEKQYLMILKELGLTKIDKVMMKVPTLFVGPVVLPDVDPKTEGTSATQPTEYIRGVDLLQKIEGTIETRGKAIKEFGKTVQGYEKIEREKKSKEFMSKTEKAEKEKLIKDVTEKDRKIKELEEAEKKLKEDDAIKAAAQKTFNDRLKKAVEKQNLIDLEALLKERDLQLSKEYETVKKESENKNRGLTKPPNLDQAIWDKLLSEIGAIKDPLKLGEYTNKFKTDNPSIDVTPFSDVEKMINAVYSAKQSKGNAPPGAKTCKETNGKPPCFSARQGKMLTGGGYRQTLRNHLRSNRSSTRRYI